MVTAAHEVVILGAGMSGLCMGARLRRAGITDFVILEKQPGLGGTWWDNVYPGAHVDVPAPLYSLSFAPNPDWRQRFAAAPEIRRYMERVARDEGVIAHMRFGQRIVEASFDAEAGRWLIRTDAGDRFSARSFVCSTGPLNQPRWPELPGLADFAGPRLHSARWDAGVPVAGRRIGVIGTGSTGSQLIPPLAAQASGLTVFQRTANWVLPRLDRRYTSLDCALARWPPYARAVRAFWYHLLELGRRGFDEGSLMRRAMLHNARSHLRRQIGDPALRERLTPPYPFGCKRIIYSNDFYPALARPNVEVVTEPIDRVEADAVVTADGRHHRLDVLVCATGFDTVHPLSSLQVRGLAGHTLAQAWADGPEAYHGVAVAGFPNLFLLLGPNTGTGHTSTLLYIEPEVDHVIQCLRERDRRGARWISVSARAQREHNAALQARLQGSVWTQCRSWYRTDAGKVVALFPGFTREYRRALERPDYADYEFG